jgi:hypothetical protein
MGFVALKATRNTITCDNKALLVHQNKHILKLMLSVEKGDLLLFFI